MVVVVVFPSLPVTAIMGGGANGEKHLHLAGHRQPFFPVFRKLRSQIPYPGGTENHLDIQVFQVVGAQFQSDPQILQFLGQAAQLFPGFPFTDSDVDPFAGHHFHNPRIGDPQPHKGHFLGPDPGKKLFYTL